jgi:urease accessory protein
LTSVLRLTSAALVAWPHVALAHAGADAGDLASGLLHPLSGLDHALTMLAVGLFAARLGRRATFLVPACFVLMMGAGAGLGYSGLVLPYVELAIAFSVAAAGMLLVSSRAPRLVVAVGLIGLFGVLHGHAHGGEIPPSAHVAAYGAGFLLGTVLLHAAGVVAAHVSRRYAARAPQLGGAVIALAGCAMIAAA